MAFERDDFFSRKTCQRWRWLLYNLERSLTGRVKKRWLIKPKPHSPRIHHRSSKVQHDILNLTTKYRKQKEKSVKWRLERKITTPRFMRDKPSKLWLRWRGLNLQLVERTQRTMWIRRWKYAFVLSSRCLLFAWSVRSTERLGEGIQTSSGHGAASHIKLVAA